ncbi:hypothetical protein ACEUZ9_004067 [Paracoccus litorisediminis]|uniref:hypothetical protein n=1 Tax=Paracoccus litorisediminis TaxID=2006130 RepID=UPI003730BD72
MSSASQQTTGKGQGSSSKPGQSETESVSLSDGTTMSIRNGVVERVDAMGEVVERRAAKPSDYARMVAAAAAQTVTNRINPDGQVISGGKAVKAKVDGRNIVLTYDDGWVEAVEGSTYKLLDENGNTVIQRAARRSDRQRLFAATEL